MTMVKTAKVGVEISQEEHQKINDLHSKLYETIMEHVKENNGIDSRIVAEAILNLFFTCMIGMCPDNQEPVSLEQIEEGVKNLYGFHMAKRLQKINGIQSPFMETPIKD